jgi:serine protease Do
VRSSFPQEDQKRGDDGGGQAMPFEDMPELREFFKGGPRQEGKEDVPPVRQGPARLGVSIEPLTADNRKEFDVPTATEGVLVRSVEPGSVAERLGIQKGHLIQQIGDKKIRTPQDLTDAMKNLKWGDKTRISFGKYSSKMQFNQTTEVEFR